MFEQLKACLTALEKGKDPEIYNSSCMEMKILETAGYAPEFRMLCLRQ